MNVSTSSSYRCKAMYHCHSLLERELAAPSACSHSSCIYSSLSLRSPRSPLSRGPSPGTRSAAQLPPPGHFGCPEIVAQFRNNSVIDISKGRTQ